MAQFTSGSGTTEVSQDLSDFLDRLTGLEGVDPSALEEMSGAAANGEVCVIVSGVKYCKGLDGKWRRKEHLA